MREKIKIRMDDYVFLLLSTCTISYLTSLEKNVKTWSVFHDLPKILSHQSFISKI